MSKGCAEGDVIAVPLGAGHHALGVVTRRYGRRSAWASSSDHAMRDLFPARRSSRSVRTKLCTARHKHLWLHREAVGGGWSSGGLLARTVAATLLSSVGRSCAAVGLSALSRRRPAGSHRAVVGVRDRGGRPSGRRLRRPHVRRAATQSAATPLTQAPSAPRYRRTDRGRSGCCCRGIARLHPRRHVSRRYAG